jgi:hypothetical protein
MVAVDKDYESGGAVVDPTGQAPVAGSGVVDGDLKEPELGHEAIELASVERVEKVYRSVVHVCH